jgi:cell division transport system ATP-binding protein
MIRFDDVGLKYRAAGRPGGMRDVLRGASFAVPEGGFRWLTGASGAGKTSLLKLITLAVHPSSGTLEIMGTNASKISRNEAAMLRRRMGIVYQDFRLLPHLTAYDNVALPLRLARRAESQISADVSEILHWVGLEDKFAAKPDELSGGEQQRIAVARAVVSRPKLLLADEPTGNLDEEQTERLMLLITSLNVLGTTVLVATHNMELTRRYPATRLHIAYGSVDEQH